MDHIASWVKGRLLAVAAGLVVVGAWSAQAEDRPTGAGPSPVVPAVAAPSPPATAPTPVQPRKLTIPGLGNDSIGVPSTSENESKPKPDALINKGSKPIDGTSGSKP